MTNPPLGSDDPGRPERGPGTGEQSDTDRHPTEPVPSVGSPDRPTGGPVPYPAQTYGQYGQPQPQGPYGPPPQPPVQPYGQYGQQPPYGQPQFGQPYGQPPAAPAKSRVGLIAAVTASIVAVIAIGVVLALTMSTTVLDRNAVQQDVAAQFEEREGVAVDLECDQEMEVASGATYECTGTTADGEDVTLQIAITDEATAAYTWAEP